MTGECVHTLICPPTPDPVRPGRAVFLDRDGVINENRADYVKSWAEFVFLPNVFQPLRDLAQNGLDVVLVSNQSIIARRILSREQVDAINQCMLAEIERQGGRIDSIYYCPHRPDEGCACRKPRPGMLFRAARDRGLDLSHSYLIGDAVSDVQAGLAAGCRVAMVLTGRGHEQVQLLHPHEQPLVHVVADLAEAVCWVLDAEARLHGS